jgi:hypothetical protein
MAADPVVEYWAEIFARTPVTPELMVQWKRVLDRGIEAWSRALSEVMATEEFAQLLGASIEQWLRAPASFADNAAPSSGQAQQLTGLAAEVRRLEERLRHVEERVGRTTEPARASVQVSRRRSRGRRAA